MPARSLSLVAATSVGVRPAIISSLSSAGTSVSQRRWDADYDRRWRPHYGTVEPIRHRRFGAEDRAAAIDSIEQLRCGPYQTQAHDQFVGPCAFDQSRLGYLWRLQPRLRSRRPISVF